MDAVTSEHRLAFCAASYFFEWIALGREVLFYQCTHQLLRVYLWLEAGMFIRCLWIRQSFGLPSENDPRTNKKILELLVACQVDDRFKLHDFLTPGQVYLRVSLGFSYRTWWYIGSTTVDVVSREYSRMRKFKQLLHGTDGFFEPALRIWRNYDLFFKFIALPLRQCSDEYELRGLETTLIQQWRPKLNHPMVNSLLKRCGVTAPSFVERLDRLGFQGARLISTSGFFAKTSLDDCALRQSWNSPQALFELLYRLGCASRTKLTTATLLRSSHTSLPFLYLLYRLVHQIDEPWKGRAKKALTQCLEFRGAAPPSNIPMALHSLAVDVKELCRIWLRELVTTQSCLFPWFHLPSTSIVYKKSPPLKNHVFNFRKFLRGWHAEDEPQCPGCQGLFTGTVFRSSGRMFATLSSVLPSIFLGHINLSDSVFPTYNQWMENAQDQFHRWRRRWRLPERFAMTWTYQAEHMWKMHARKSAVVSMRSHRRDLKALKGYILCPADHHPHQAHLSCPVHYHWLLRKTFLDEEVFRVSSIGWHTVFERILGVAKDTLPSHIFRLLDAHGHCPSAYILPKPSKMFNKARPIISYTLSWNEKLGQFIGHLVLSLISSIFGDVSLDRKVVDIILGFHRLFRDVPCQWELDFEQQDLSGFFNSVPQSRMLESIQFALNLYRCKSQLPADSTLSVYTKDDDRHLRLFRGRYRAAGGRYINVDIQHVFPAVNFLLAHSFFSIGRMLFQQIQGASMGSHFAPALCGLVAACQEYCFQKAFRDLINSHNLLLNARYVDNRAMVGMPFWRDSYHWNSFTREDFYGRPILLEEVVDPVLLGCHIDLNQRTCTVRLDNDLTRYRPGLTEGSRQPLRSALTARIWMILRYTFPPHLILPQEQDLVAIATRTHMNLTDIRTVFRPLLGKIREATCLHQDTLSQVLRRILFYVERKERLSTEHGLQ